MRKHLIFIIFCIAGLTPLKSQDYTGYTHCAEQDSLALVAFYNATGGPSWTCNADDFDINSIGSDGDYGLGLFTYYPNAGKSKWLVGPVKDWFGVVLEKQQIGSTSDSAWRVIMITPTLSRRDNGNNNMNGYIPREVGLLTALQWFRINGNKGFFKSEIPDELYHPTITRLDLESTGVGGIISSGFRKCTKIEQFNVRYNYIDSLPVFDFLTPDHLIQYFKGNNMFLYSNQFSYATWEKSVDYFTSFTSTPTIKYQVQSLRNVGREREILTTPGSSVTLICNEAGEQGTVTWMRKDLVSEVDTSLEVTGKTYTINNISAKDTGTYKGACINTYIADWQVEGNSDVYNVAVLTKPIHVVFTPSTPICKSFYTSYSGNEIYITFSKVMAIPESSQASEFTVLQDGINVDINSISRTGRLSDTYVLNLESSITDGSTVTISYTPGTIVDKNGGVLKAFSGKDVKNYAREQPVVFNNAITRKDGKGIILSFDRYIDPNSLDPADFSITQSNDGSQEIVAAIIKPGKLDKSISRSIQLAVKNIIYDSTATITVSYEKGSMTGLYAGAVQSFTPISVHNTVTPIRSTITLQFNDLCGNIDNVIASGSIECVPSFKLYDDGTNGDKVANDHNWARKIVDIASDEYDWEVYKREIISYDTTYLEDNVKVLTPVYDAEQISPTLFISFEDKKVGNDTLSVFSSGDSLFWKCDKYLVFLLDMNKYIEQNPDVNIEPYLMGIAGDWKDGLIMEKIKDPKSNDSVYYIMVDQLSVGDPINFLFRNGSYPNGHWEEQGGPQNRNYTVQDSDTLRFEFMMFETTSIPKTKNETLRIYPNPVSEQLFISTPDNNAFFDIKVYNLYGQCVITANDLQTSSLDVTQLADGMYILDVHFKNGSRKLTQFIKN